MAPDAAVDLDEGLPLGPGGGEHGGGAADGVEGAAGGLQHRLVHVAAQGGVREGGMHIEVFHKYPQIRN